MFEYQENQALIRYVQSNLECKGRLCQNPGGFLYLLLEDGFVYDLFQFVDEPDKLIPDYFSATNFSGAHISVVYPEELLGLGLGLVGDGSSSGLGDRSSLVRSGLSEDRDGGYLGSVTDVIARRDLGKIFEFKLGRYFRAQLRQKIYFGCTIESVGLTAIRAELGLPALLNFRGDPVPLHFTIAVRTL